MSKRLHVKVLSAIYALLIKSLSKQEAKGVHVSLFAQDFNDFKNNQRCVCL